MQANTESKHCMQANTESNHSKLAYVNIFHGDVKTYKLMDSIHASKENKTRFYKAFVQAKLI